MIGQRNKKRKMLPGETKKRNKYITPQKFLELPLSEAIIQVIEDVKSMKRVGIDIYMSSWFETDNDGQLCSVCLGGAAICSLAPDKINGYGLERFGNKVLGLKQSEVVRISRTFDYVRQGFIKPAFHTWYDQSIPMDLWTSCSHLDDYHGSIKGKDLSEMLKSLGELAKTLAEHGY